MKKRSKFTKAIALALLLALCVTMLNACFVVDGNDVTSFFNKFTDKSTETTSNSPTNSNNSTTSNDNTEFPYAVSRVIDGDTFMVKDADGNELKVRLIGVDTPESVHSDESKNCEAGKEASNWAKEFLTGQNVRLEFDVGREDKYGRTLAYVWLEDGRMFQDILLNMGYAHVMTVPPNVAYADHFLELQVKARENNVGFWSDDWDANWE